MKKTKLIISIFIIILMIIIPLTINASQINPDTYNPGPINQGDLGKLPQVTGNILATIRNVGIIISVIVLSIIGLKYILGSLQEKAEYKENMTLYIIGCFLLMMATTIPSLIYDIMN